MKTAIRIGMLGMGTVGTGVAKMLTANAEGIRQKTGVPVELKTVLVRTPTKTRSFSAPVQFTTDFREILEDRDIDIIVEVMGGEEPAKSYILQALKAGKHVVTANKDVMAKYGRELFEAAEASGVDLLFEASVGGGIPIIRPLKQCLAGNKIQEVMGIVNGTTNYILTKMTGERADYATVLAEAQAKGYAESDPTADVGGFDAARKIAILASIAFGTRLTVNDVHVEGITRITPYDIEYAGELGYAIKLLAVARDTAKGVDVRVHPAFIPLTHPLAAVSDVFNAIFVKGDAVGETMFYGRGAGEMPTASAVVGDIIDICRNIRHNVNSRILCTCFDNKPLCSVEDVESPFYIRLLVADKPGVLASIAGVFGTQKVSLHSVIQKRKIGDRAEIVLLTYRVPEANMNLALYNLNKLPVVAQVSNIIRVVASDF